MTCINLDYYAVLYERGLCVGIITLTSLVDKVICFLMLVVYGIGEASLTQYISNMMFLCVFGAIPYYF